MIVLKGPPPLGLGEGLTILHCKKNGLLRTATQGLGRTVMNRIMKLPVPERSWEFFVPAERLSDSQGLCAKEF